MMARRRDTIRWSGMPSATADTTISAAMTKLLERWKRRKFAPSGQARRVRAAAQIFAPAVPRRTPVAPPMSSVTNRLFIMTSPEH